MSGTKMRHASSAGELSPALEFNPSGLSAMDLDRAIATLEALDISNLQMRWRDMFGHNAPARLGADLLRRAIAHRLQELALGSLSRQAQLRLKSLGQRSSKGGSSGGSSSLAQLVKPGTRFVREWQGQMHEVQAIDTGDFVYRGKAYRSLSVIAREITGTHQSGPRFFGLGRNQRQKARREKLNG